MDLAKVLRWMIGETIWIDLRSYYKQPNILDKYIFNSSWKATKNYHLKAPFPARKKQNTLEN